MKVRPQAIFSFLFLIFFIVFVYQAQEWRLQARLYPWAIGIPMIILAIIQVILDLKGVDRKQKDEAPVMDYQFSQTVEPAVAKRRAIIMFGWLFGFLLSIWLIGFSITIPLMARTINWAMPTIRYPKTSERVLLLMTPFTVPRQRMTIRQ